MAEHSQHGLCRAGLIRCRRVIYMAWEDTSKFHSVIGPNPWRERYPGEVLLPIKRMGHLTCGSTSKDYCSEFKRCWRRHQLWSRSLCMRVKLCHVLANWVDIAFHFIHKGRRQFCDSQSSSSQENTSSSCRHTPWGILQNYCTGHVLFTTSTSNH